MCVWCVISKLIKVMDCYHVIDLFHVTLTHRNSRVPGNKNIGLNISSQIKSSIPDVNYGCEDSVQDTLDHNTTSQV